MTNCLLSAKKWKLILLRYFFLKTQLNNTAKFKPTAIIHISLYKNKHGSHIKCVARLFFNICQRIIETKHLTVMWVEHCKIIFYLKQWTTISMSRRIALEIALLTKSGFCFRWWSRIPQRNNPSEMRCAVIGIVRFRP